MNTDRNAVIELKSVLDKYLTKPISFPAEELDAVQGFFVKRGFGVDASRSLSIVVLNQAYIDRISVFQLLDRLVGVSDVQLNDIITEVMNVYRNKSSVLGVKDVPIYDILEHRNILV